MNYDLQALMERWDGLAVVCRYDHPTQTWVFICMHDNTLGPCMGGTRIKVYSKPGEGLLDAMRLAEGMTNKWAAIDVAAGGGKAVLAVERPLEGEERRGLLLRYGRLIQTLGGGSEPAKTWAPRPKTCRWLPKWPTTFMASTPRTAPR